MGDLRPDDDITVNLEHMSLNHRLPDSTLINVNGLINKTKEKMDCVKVMENNLVMEGVFRMKKKSSRFPNARYYCRICEYHCDSLQVCIKHVKDKRHIENKEMVLLDISLSRIPKPNEVHLDAITDVINTVAAENSLTPPQIEERETIRKNLESEMEKRLPGISLKIAGSTLSGFALKNSNLNIGMVIPDGIKMTKVYKVAVSVLEDQAVYRNLKKNLSASTPNLEFTHIATEVCVNLRIHCPLAEDTAILMSHYCKLDPRLKILATAFSKWARICGINSEEQGTLPSYCFPLMTIHFLQHTNPPVLPCLHDKTPSLSEFEYCKPENLSPPWVCENKQSVGELWVEMLRFYAVSLVMSHYIINIRYYKSVPRGEKTWGKKIFIEDPFKTKKNITRSISNKSVFDYIMDVLKLTFRYFAVPRTSYGMLYKSVWEGSIFEKKMNAKSDTPTRERRDSVDSKGEDEDGSKPEVSKVPGINWTTLNKWPDITEDVIAYDIDREILSKPLTTTLNCVSPWLAQQLHVTDRKYLLYNFSQEYFTEGRTLPIQCKTCFTLGHTQEFCKEYELPDLVPLPRLKPRYCMDLTNVINEIKEYCEPTLSRVHDRNDLVDELQDFLQELYPSAELHLFGSSANGFGFDQSDVDICLTIDELVNNKENDHVEIIEKIAMKLRTLRHCCRVIPITTARVPIVKFFHKRSRLEVDISLYNTPALRNTQLLSTYASIDKRVRCLGYGMKYFAKVCDIGDASRGSLSSYAYILMVIHYLQQCNPPVVPVLQEMYEGKSPEELHEGWNCWFYSDLENLASSWKGYHLNKQSIGELWVGLFRYYTEIFDWEEDVVTIRQSEPLSRLEKMWTTNCIAIEDPFVLSHNLGGGLSRKMSTYIRKCLIKGREIFGTGYKDTHGPTRLLNFLFDRDTLTDGASPPNDRGCRVCGKIGHKVKDCPRKVQQKVMKEKRRKEKMKQENSVANPTEKTTPKIEQKKDDNIRHIDKVPDSPRPSHTGEVMSQVFTNSKEPQGSSNSNPNSKTLTPNALFEMAAQAKWGSISLGPLQYSNIRPPPGLPIPPRLAQSRPINVPAGQPFHPYSPNQNVGNFQFDGRPKSMGMSPNNFFALNRHAHNVVPESIQIQQMQRKVNDFRLQDNSMYHPNTSTGRTLNGMSVPTSNTLPVNLFPAPYFNNSGMPGMTPYFEESPSKRTDRPPGFPDTK